VASRLQAYDADGTREVAPGVIRVTRAHTNSYLIVGDDGVALVDAGVPGAWRLLVTAMGRLGIEPRELTALLLTHGHFDHVGTARRLRAAGVPVWVHAGDRRLARHPYRYRHEQPRIRYPFAYPRAIPVLWSMTLAGALGVRGVEASQLIQPGQPLAVPGAPLAIATPGHTAGHVALHLPERDVLLTGDALVTLDPYTGRTGPRIVADAATANHAEALASLDLLAATGAGTVLPGHGLPARSIESAVETAKRVGPA
jgi:glyoxylase-like metal-dependent hydrolase (beta-lactamase superfamily II)